MKFTTKEELLTFIIGLGRVNDEQFIFDINITQLKNKLNFVGVIKNEDELPDTGELGDYYKVDNRETFEEASVFIFYNGEWERIWEKHEKDFPYNALALINN